MDESEIVVEGEGTNEEMQDRVSSVLEEKDWVNRRVQFFYETNPPEKGSGPYRVHIIPPGDDEPLVKSF